MAETTPNLGLKKPLETEHADVAVINSNMDNIDQVLGDIPTVPTAAKDVAGAISELFTNVSDGKTLIASAITDKGVPTDANDSFADMASNIEGIRVGPDTSDATAAAGDIRSGKTAYVKGEKVGGQVPVKGASVPGHESAITYEVSGSNVYLKAPRGIYDQDTWIVQPESALISANVKSGASILGVPGKSEIVDTSEAAVSAVSAEHILNGRVGHVNGLRVVGTMPHRLGDTASTTSTISGSTLKLRPSEGYRNGTSDYVTITDPNFLSQNIRNGVNLFGLNGTLAEGKKYASGSVTCSASGALFYRYDGSSVQRNYVTVSGLSFPSEIQAIMLIAPNYGRLAAFNARGFYSIDTKFHDSNASYRAGPNAYVSNTGFLIPVSATSSEIYYWEAWGE